MAEGIKIGAAFIEINADVREAEGDLNRFRRDVNGSRATLNVHADTLIANGQIALAARSRFVDLNLRVNGLAAVGKSLAALSGGAAVGKIIGNIGSNLADLPANLPKIAMVSISIFAIAGAALAATSGTLALAGGLASVAGAGLALPGIMAGFAVGAGVLIAALKDAPTVLADLGPAFSSLQDSISSNFWSQAAAPIRDMVNGLLPQLSTGLNTVATDLGSFFGQAASALQSALGGGVLDGMMASLSSSIQIAGGAIQPLVGAFTTLGTVGATYLPQLATWFVSISEKFNAFIQGASADGRLQGWINTGIGALQSLGSVVGSIADIFYGLYSAATSAGAAPLQILSDGLGKIAAVVNGPAFQGALSTLFAGASGAMTGLGAALRPIGDMFVKLAPTIATVMTMAGQLAGQVLTGLASALSQPAFATGLTAFFEGIQTGIAAVLPHLPTLGTLFGTLMSVVGQLAAIIGPVLGAAISALAPAFMTILGAVQPLIPILGGALVQIVTALSPLLQVVASVFAQLAPIIGTVVSALAPLITTLVGYLVPVITALMPLVTTVFGAIASIITSVMTIVQGVIQTMTGLITGDWDMAWNGIKQILSGIWDTIVAVVKGAFDILVAIATMQLKVMSTIINTVFTGISGFVSGVWNSIVGFIRGAFQNAVNFVSGGVSAISSFISNGFNGAVGFVRDAFSNISNAVSNGINDAVNFVSGLPGRVLGALGNLGGLLSGAGNQIIQGFLNGLKAGFESVKSFVGGIGDWIAANKGPKAYDLALLIPNGGWIMKGLKAGIERGIPDLNKTLSGVAASVSTGIGDMSANVMLGTQSSIPQEVGRGLTRNSGSLQSSGSQSYGTMVIENVTIDASSIKDFNSVVEIFNSLGQTARTGRGIQNARIA